MVSKRTETTLILNKCEFVRVPKLNGVVFQNRKILSYHKKVERTLSDFQMFTNFATPESLQIANESLKY